MDVIQLTCGHCQHSWFYDASAIRLDAAAFDEISQIACPDCGQRGVALTLDPETSRDQQLEPLPGS
jgi:hypothetical protein